MMVEATKSWAKLQASAEVTGESSSSEASLAIRSLVARVFSLTKRLVIVWPRAGSCR